MKFLLEDLRQIIAEAAGDAYKVLGVNRNATAAEIKKAYREKAIALHPDKNPGVDTAKEMMRVNIAFDLLKDDTKRRRYDMWGDKTMDTYSDPASSNDTTKKASYSDYSPPPPPQQPRSSYSSSAGPESYSEWKARQERDAQAKARGQSSSSYSDQSSYNDNTKTGVYLVYRSQGSSKYWAIRVQGNYLAVRYGKIGTPGRVIRYDLYNFIDPQFYIRKTVRQKKMRGYQEVAAPAGFWSMYDWYSGKTGKTQGAGRASSTRGTRSSTTRGKDTYKVHGPHRNDRGFRRPAHIRYKTKAYVSGHDTKFRKGDTANVSVNQDGTLNVKDPRSNHTQTWDPTNESRQFVIESVMKTLQRFIVI